MTLRRFVMAMIGVLTLSGLVGAAMAEPAATPLAPVSGFEDFKSGTSDDVNHARNRLFQFNMPGRWGFTLGVNQPNTAPSGINDIDAGAFFKVTPSVRVGGTVGFGERTRAFKAPTTTEKTDEPRVRLETTLKF